MRPVPRLIDSNSRLGEYLMVLMVPLFLLRTIDPLLGLVVGCACSITYVRMTLGKPEGYLIHRLYRLGVRLGGFPDPRIRRFVP
jgi:hypothetical protein